MEEGITFRAVIEVLGQPQEHIEAAIKSYVAKLKENKDYEVLAVEFSETKKQENQELWAAFAEVDVKTANIPNLVAFCFDYMPSLIDILEPKSLSFKSDEISMTFNDLMAKLHQVDMVAKQFRLENQHLVNDRAQLLKNYITLLLRNKNLTADVLANLIGMKKETLEDFLDQLIDEGKVDLKEGIYFLKK